MIFLLAVTATSMLVAAVMSAIAWRLAGAERRRSQARIAALSADIHGAAAPTFTTVSERSADDLELRPVFERDRYPSAPPSDLFAGPRPRSRSRLFAALAGVALVLGVGATIGMPRNPRMVRAGDEHSAPAPLPLELVALAHERVGDQLTVRGVVRNPPAGAGMTRLSAVVLLFTSDGGFLASGSADVEAPALPPGSESTFAVTIPRAGDVGRYRVSFKADDRVVPHLDRRHES